MKDTHETNLPAEETGKLEETKAPEVTPENTAAEVETTETPDEATANAISKLSKEEILEKLDKKYPDAKKKIFNAIIHKERYNLFD